VSFVNTNIIVLMFRDVHVRVPAVMLPMTCHYSLSLVAMLFHKYKTRYMTPSPVEGCVVNMPFWFINSLLRETLEKHSKCRVDDTGFDSGSTQEIFFFLKTSRLALGPIQRPIQRISRVLAPGERWSGREFKHLIPSGVDVKNEWTSTSL
jgi:hypothetical protein